MSKPTEADEPLPGLEEPDHPPTDLEKAVRRTIKALADDELIVEKDAARTALAMSLAQVIEDKIRRHRTSTVANDARVLVELLDRIAPGEVDVNETLRKAMALWEEEMNRGEPADGPAEVRDSA